MAKPRGKTKGGSKKKKGRASKGPDISFQIAKVFGALAILLVLVLAGGLLAEHYLKRPGENSSAAVRPGISYPEPGIAPPPVKRHKIRKYLKPEVKPELSPTYEVPTKSTPPTKPLAPLPQLPGERRPLVAIIIDDIGYDRHIADLFMGLKVPLTFSMLPYSTFGGAIQKKARSNGLEIMLHLPMEPHEYPSVNPGPGALLADMSPDDLISRLKEDIDQFPGLKGVNNHMGSRLSTSSSQMRQIFTILKKKGLYYVDSRTTAETVAEPSARLLQLPFAERDIFIDHFEDENFVRSQLQRLVKRAQEQGYAIGIGHPHAVTYKGIRDFMPTLQSAVALVPASMVVNEVTLARSRGDKGATARR